MLMTMIAVEKQAEWKKSSQRDANTVRWL